MLESKVAVCMYSDYYPKAVTAMVYSYRSFLNKLKDQKGISNYYNISAGIIVTHIMIEKVSIHEEFYTYSCYTLIYVLGQQ